MFSLDFLSNFMNVLSSINPVEIESVVNDIIEIRNNNGRLFIIGVGGSAGNASHAVNDFRKLTNIESYCPTDNVPELTARTNDEGWDTVFSKWLEVSRLKKEDGIMLISVGGGNLELNVSKNLIESAKFSKNIGAKIISIVGRDGGEIRKFSTSSVLIPPLYPNMVTPITEAMHSVILHLLVTHPLLAKNKTKW